MIPLDHARSSAEADVWTAFSMAISYVVGAAGPVVIGLLHDVTGSFTCSSWLMVGIALTMIAICPSLRPASMRPVLG
jgi:MFS transporter, CP family, cyanate transporter